MFECKNTSSAAALKKLIADNYDANKWGCATAEQCVVVESGVYVLLIASTPARCTSIYNAFVTVAGGAGNVGTKNIFFNI
jgi:hypothetical protein